MRVLHFYRTYFPDTQGGLEETIRQLCLSTSALGAECRVLTLSHKPTPSEVVLPEARVYRVKNQLEIASCGMSIAAFRRFKELADWADLVHFHFPWPFADVVTLLSASRTPSVVTYHSDIVRQKILGTLYTPLMNRFLSKVDQIICTSPNYFATSPVLQRFESKVKTIPIGIDESSYPQPSPKDIEVTREEHGDDFFLFIGVLRYYKGLHILLDAAADSSEHFVIVGSGPIEHELRRQAANLRLENISFAGHVDNRKKMSLLHLCRAVVFPSYLRAEAFGVTLLEGAMYGKPLISTEVGSGTSHINIHQECGLVVTPGSSEALRAAIHRVSSNPNEAARMGRAARKRFEKHFTGERMGQSHMEVYDSLVNTTPNTPQIA